VGGAAMHTPLSGSRPGTHTSELLAVGTQTGPMWPPQGTPCPTRERAGLLATPYPEMHVPPVQGAAVLHTGPVVQGA
jgi:hypothetical protein